MWVNFDELPLQSRVWVFQSNRIMSPSEQSSIDAAVKQFVQKWSTHGVQMLASNVLYHNCFVVIAADEQKKAASGCSIDYRSEPTLRTQAHLLEDHLSKICSRDIVHHSNC